MTLLVTSARTGNLLDVVSLDGGRLVYRTGRARSLFESRRDAVPGANLSDGRLYELLADWSNGYVTIQPAPGGPATKHEGHGDATHHVYAYLARHYPAEVLEWVKDAHWHNPQTVKLSDIDMARRPGGARNPDKVRQIRWAIEDGHQLDPIVLVATPDSPPYEIADGWHRTDALKLAGRTTVRAWVGRVDSDDGDWGARMNRAKLNKARAQV